MKGLARAALFGMLPLLALTACGTSNKESVGSSQSFVAGNGTVTFKSASTRAIAPHISSATLDGGTFTLVPGQVSVINVWASWCAPCRAEAPALVALANSFPDVRFIGILTRDNESTARAFVKRFQIPYPTLTDDSLLLGFHNSLAANAIPSTVVIDKRGKVAARISGEITVDSLREIIERLRAE